MKYKNYCVVCDGGKRSGMSYGSFVVYDRSGIQITHRQMFFGFGTSLEAEFLALFNAVDFCLKNNYKNVIFKTDSAELIKHLSDSSRTKKDRIKKLSKRINDRLRRLEFYSLIKVPRKQVKAILGH